MHERPAGDAMTTEQVQRELAALPGWTLTTVHAAGRVAATDAAALARSYTFPTFRAAISFIGRVADEAERVDHHPTLCTTYATVDVVLWSHEVGGVTGRDLDLARRVDAVARTDGPGGGAATNGTR